MDKKAKGLQKEFPESITFPVTSKMKDEFQENCHYFRTTMSQALRAFVAHHNSRKTKLREKEKNQ